MTTSKPTYIYIPESSGVTQTLTPANPNIGTSELITCVGVYLPISPTRCFVAHINAYFEKPGAKSLFDKRWTIPAHGEHYKAEVLERLREHSQKEGWSAKDVVGSGRKVVVMCPNYEDQKPPGLRLSGVFVVEAIREFVGEVPVEEYFDDDRLKGFVVNHSTGEVHVLPQRWQTSPEGKRYRVGNSGDEGWTRDEVSWRNNQEWHIMIDAKSWRSNRGD